MCSHKPKSKDFIFVQDRSSQTVYVRQLLIDGMSFYLKKFAQGMQTRLEEVSENSNMEVIGTIAQYYTTLINDIKLQNDAVPSIHKKMKI